MFIVGKIIPLTITGRVNTRVLHVCYECVGSAILFTPLLPLGNVVEYSFVAMKMRKDMSK